MKGRAGHGGSGESNYPGYVGVTPGGESSFERREETINYEIGESKQTTLTAPGKVIRMHTSVVIDNGDNFLGADVIQQVNNLVSAAIGFDAARGDLISVESMSFDRSLEEKMDTALAEMEQQQRREQLIRQAVLGGAALIAFVVLMLLLRRRRRLQSEEVEEAIPADRRPSLEQLLALEEKEDYLPEMSLESSPQVRAENGRNTSRGSCIGPAILDGRRIE